MGEHALPLRQHAALHLLGHERLRPFRARRSSGPSLTGSPSPASWRRSPSRSPAAAPTTPGARASASASQRAPRLVPAAALFLLIATGSGIWYFYNAHVLNEYLTAKDLRDIRAAYERDFKKYEKLPQPKTIAVDANIDIFPERRSFSGTGHFVLQNKTAQPIAPDPHHQPAAVRLRSTLRPRHSTSSPRAPAPSTPSTSSIRPLAPGDKLDLTFHVGYTSRGFKDGNERPELAYSGTFFDSGYFPTIGYDSGIELDDPRRRREEDLPEQELLPHRGDAAGAVTNLFTPQSDWISYRTTVSTADDQIALSPGYLTRDWHANGRHYFTYDMGNVKTLDFTAYVSARYNVKREMYRAPPTPSPSRSTIPPPTPTMWTT